MFRSDTQNRRILTGELAKIITSPPAPRHSPSSSTPAFLPSSPPPSATPTHTPRTHNRKRPVLPFPISESQPQIAHSAHPITHTKTDLHAKTQHKRRLTGIRGCRGLQTLQPPSLISCCLEDPCALSSLSSSDRKKENKRH